MDLASVVLIAIGLAMDAMAVSVCKGLSLKNPSLRDIAIVGLWFGVFQALMPVIGFFLGSAMYDLISEFDHWIAFILLALIGLNMVREGLSGEDESIDSDVGVRAMLPLAVATSIDALAVGITFAMTEGTILVPALIIGAITFVISAVGVKAGSYVGTRFGSVAEIIGGVILVLMGLRILLDHTGLLRSLVPRLLRGPVD